MFIILSRSIEIRRGLFPGAVTVMCFIRLRIVVLIVLIGGIYDWGLGGQAGKMQTSQSFCCNKKIWHTPKILLGVLGGWCCANILNGLF